MRKEQKYYGLFFQWRFGPKKFTMNPYYQNKKIAVIENSLFSTYTMRDSLMKTLLQQGHEVTVLTHTNSFVSHVEKTGLKVINIGSGNLNPFKIFRYSLNLFLALKKIKPDVASHSVSGRPSLATLSHGTSIFLLLPILLASGLCLQAKILLTG